MCYKHNLTINIITKYKARLNINICMEAYGINYFETYVPVVIWCPLTLLIVFAILFKWALKQVDFFVAYIQAPIEMDMNVELPAGIDTKHGDSKSCVLKLPKNLCGLI